MTYARKSLVSLNDTLYISAIRGGQRGPSPRSPTKPVPRERTAEEISVELLGFHSR